jgi:hypothetical protein
VVLVKTVFSDVEGKLPFCKTTIKFRAFFTIFMTSYTRKWIKPEPFQLDADGKYGSCLCKRCGNYFREIKKIHPGKLAWLASTRSQSILIVVQTDIYIRRKKWCKSCCRKNTKNCYIFHWEILICIHDLFFNDFEGGWWLASTRSQSIIIAVRSDEFPPQEKVVKNIM